MVFELLCATMIALVVGAAACFSGYRWFVILLPVWGFGVGFGLGAQTVTALLGVGFLATISGWIVGFALGAVFSVLSYFFYQFGVVIMAGFLGYTLGIGVMGLVGFDLGVISWLVGAVVALGFIVATIRWDLAPYVITVATATGGAALIVITLMSGPAGLAAARLLENPVREMLAESFWWAVFYVVLVAAGIASQLAISRKVEEALEPGRAVERPTA